MLVSMFVGAHEVDVLVPIVAVVGRLIRLHRPTHRGTVLVPTVELISAVVFVSAASAQVPNRTRTHVE